MMKKRVVVMGMVMLCVFGGGSVVSVRAEDQIEVTFVSCCLPEGFFWPKVETFMAAAADDLNINLEVIYAEMNHVKMTRLATDVANRPHPPDYLIVDNYKLQGGDMIQAADAAGVKVFLMANGLNEELVAEFGTPREKFSHWIGELTPDNHFAGYHLTKTLIDQALAQGGKAGDGTLHLLAVAGDHVTPAGLQREAGLAQAVAEYPDVVLQQVFPGHWQQAEAYKRVSAALDRFPETGAIWAANDEMALGAIEAAVEAGKIPGQNIFFGGVNWKKEALQKVENGTMAGSVGGHFMMGAWTLVVLYDYHHGKDFVDEGVQLRQTIFDVLTAKNVQEYLSIFGDEDWQKIDFTRFSKILNPTLTDYEFSVEAILRQRF